MKSYLLLCGLVSGMFITSQCAAEDWSGFRGPNGQGFAKAKNLPTEWSDEKNVAWKTDLPGWGSSSPISVGDKLYVTCYSGFGIERGERLF